MAINPAVLSALVQPVKSVSDYEDMYAERDARQQRNALLQMQMAQAKQGMQQQEAVRNAFAQYGASPQAVNALMSAGAVDQATALESRIKAQQKEQALRGYLGSLNPAAGPARPFDIREAASRLGDPALAAQLHAIMSPQKKDAIVAKPGEQVFMPQEDGSFKSIISVPEKVDQPSDVKAYEYAKGQGYRGTFEQWQLASKRAGANSVNLSVNTAKNLTGELAQGLGKQLDASLSGAQSAIGAINTARQISSLVDSGKVVVGPFADKRVGLLRVGEALGVTGANEAEKLAGTAALVKNLAQSELDAAQQMKGQGQITESERAILKRAAAGDINMSGPELKTLAGAMEKTARTRIRFHQQQVQKLQAVDGAGPVLPFYQVDEPSAEPVAKPSAVRSAVPASGGLSPQEQAELDALRKRFSKGQ